MTRRYDFRPATRADLPLLRRWMTTPDVARWWHPHDPFDDADLADPGFRPWIVSLEGQPFAYLQDYLPHAWEGHHFAQLAPGARGIDQFIGLPDMLGRGHGTGLIAAHLATLLGEGAPVVATDPHPDNARAVACYARVGFRPAGPPQDTPWGRILPMHATPPATIGQER